MESGNYQHCHCRNNDLYIYTECRTMRNYSIAKCNCQPAGHTNIYANRTILPEQHSACIANNIKQWHYRILEPCNYQYIGHRHHYVHIYTECRSVRHFNHDGRSDHIADYTNIYPDRTVVPEQYCASIAGNITKQHYWYMEPCSDQHFDCWFHNLYFHT